MRFSLLFMGIDIEMEDWSVTKKPVLLMYEWLSFSDYDEGACTEWDIGFRRNVGWF